MMRNWNRLIKRVALMASLVYASASAGGVLQAAVIPAWMSATGNATIDIPSPITAGFHRAESGVGTIAGSATFGLNSGSLNNWIFRDDGDYDSVPTGSPLDMVYGKSRTVAFSVVAADTLRINTSFGRSATGPNFGQGNDLVVEQQLLRITAQTNETVVVTFSSFGSGSGDAGSGGSTSVSNFGGIFEDLVQISPTIAGTYNLVAGRTYDIFSNTSFTVNENAQGFNGAGFSFGDFGTIDIQVITVPEPTSLALMGIAGLILIRRRRM